MILNRDDETLQAVLDSLAEGVIVADENGEFLFFNKSAERILGMGSGDFTASNWALVHGFFKADKSTPYPPEQLPLARAIAGEEVINEDIFIKNPERTKGLWIIVSASPLKDADGLINGGTMVFRDITERRSTREKLELFARVVEQTADNVIITNTEGIIKYVNPAFMATTGYTREETVGHKPRMLKSGRHDNAFYEKLWREITNGKPYQGTIVNKKKNGELYWSEQTITPMRDSEGNITHYVSLLKDITELRKQQDQEFQLGIAREVQQRLNETVSVPGFDIAGVTHSATHTSGDYHDFILMPDGCLWIVVGDVAGHGIAAALIMAETRAYLRAFVRMDTDPAIILTRLNGELFADLKEGHFVTLILVRLDPREHSLMYASAGHDPAYLLNASGEVTYVMESTGIPLGFIQDYKIYASEPINLESGDIAVFLTDGIIEAKSPDESEFGSNRALDVIKSHWHHSAHEIASSVCREVRSFSENEPQQDDMTSVICKVNPIA